MDRPAAANLPAPAYGMMWQPRPAGWRQDGSEKQDFQGTRTLLIGCAAEKIATQKSATRKFATQKRAIWRPARAACWSVAALLAGTAAAAAQGGAWYERNPQREQVCVRLEAQLAALDRSPNDGRAEQIRRYEDTLNRQQVELDRTIAQSRRLGCERTGFFLFGGGQPPQCDQLRTQIDRMRSNLDRMMSTLQEARGGGNDRDGQRQSVLIALAQNACGPQYQAAVRQQAPRGLFDSLFGSQAPPAARSLPAEPSRGSGYRTVCVRKCDGSFFPISFATSPARFPEDERTCRRACPAADVELYTYRNPGEDIAQATSVSGRPYTELPNAFRFRQEYNAACTCKRPGESWTAAVGEDPTLERGDIVVTDEEAKAMSQPKPQPSAGARNARPPEPAANTSPGHAPQSQNDAPRSVGPQFLPAR